MAIELFLGKETGSALSMSLPVDIVETSDPQVPISLDDAIDAVEGELGDLIPETMPPFDLPHDGNPGTQRLSPHAFRFTINYRPPNSRPLSPPTGAEVRSGFQAYAQPRFLMWAPEVAVFAAPPNAGDPGTMDGVILGAGDGQFGGVGLLVSPGAETFYRDLTMPLASVTASYIRSLVRLVRAGYVNSAALTSSAYPAGTIQLVSASGAQVSDTEFALRIGWSYALNVTGESRGNVTGIAYHGHHLVWEYRAQAVDRARIMTTLSPDRVVVNQVWPTTDLAVIGVEPP